VSENWQAGDQALCIKLGPWVASKDPAKKHVIPGPRGGEHCTVEQVFPEDGFLVIKNHVTIGKSGKPTRFKPDRFVKVTPPKSEDELDRSTNKELENV